MIDPTELRSTILAALANIVGACSETDVADEGVMQDLANEIAEAIERKFPNG